MKMTVSLEKPEKASPGVSTPVIASRHTTTRAVTSIGIDSSEKRTMATMIMISTSAMDVVTRCSCP